MILTVSICFISLALLGYSTAIWSEKFAKRLKTWMIAVFALAFSCDLVGTSIMFYLSPTKFSFAAHSLCGYGALFIMSLHLIWAIVSLKARGKSEIYFHRFSIYAWIVWLAAFITGIPKG